MLDFTNFHDGDLNPKVQSELEKLNTASAQINEFENKLQELRNAFSESLSKLSSNLSEISCKLGQSLPNARPYFEYKRAQSELQRESQIAASRYEAACAELNHSNSVVLKSELIAKETSRFDDSAMEILNIAIAKVNMAKAEKAEAHREHQRYLSMYIDLDDRIHSEERKHKNDIKKSMEYFTFSKYMDDKLKEEKLNIEAYEEKVSICKALYNKSLQRLEEISNQIHEERKQKELLGPRGEGVGAEIVSINDQRPQHKFDEEYYEPLNLSIDSITAFANPTNRRLSLETLTLSADGLFREARLENQTRRKHSSLRDFLLL